MAGTTDAYVPEAETFIGFPLPFFGLHGRFPCRRERHDAARTVPVWRVRR